MISKDAAKKILTGGLVIFPTETVYGLGALANNDKAVEKIFEVKGRPAHNPLILHIANNEQLAELVEKIPESAQKLIDAFWPGPLTICFKKSDKVSDLVTAGLDTVCVRRPDHKIAQEFLQAVAQPVAAPSANLSGKPSTTTFMDAKNQLEEKNVHFIDDGETKIGLESTVIDCSGKQVQILRPGSVSQEDIEFVLSRKILKYEDEEIRSPGQLLSHYAPEGELTVLQGTPNQRREWISKHNFVTDKKYVFGVINSGSTPDFPGKTYDLSQNEKDLVTYATKLYKFLNWANRQGANLIILELPIFKGNLLPALLNRLEKAAAGKIIRL